MMYCACMWQTAASGVIPAATRATMQHQQVSLANLSALRALLCCQVQGMDAEWCKVTDEGLPAPDLTLYFKVDGATAAARGGYGEERYEKREFQEKVGHNHKMTLRYPVCMLQHGCHLVCRT